MLEAGYARPVRVEQPVDFLGDRREDLAWVDSAGPPHYRSQPGRGIPFEGSPHPLRVHRALPGEQRRRAVRLVADHPGDTATEISQRLLGVHEVAQFLLGLGVGDRRRGALGEFRHPRLGIGREIRPRGHVRPIRKADGSPVPGEAILLAAEPQ
jgi:hypothetical protein